MKEEDIHNNTQHIAQSNTNVIQPLNSVNFRGLTPKVTEAVWSPQHAGIHPQRPLLLALHGWGSNEEDLAYTVGTIIAPNADVVALRAPFSCKDVWSISSTMPAEFVADGYTWLTDMVPTGEQLDLDVSAACNAVLQWVEEHVPPERKIVPIGFSQGGLMAVHLLRANPQRFMAAVSLSGFHADGKAVGSAPYDDELAAMMIPVFFGYGLLDRIVPQYELESTSAWLDEHTFLTMKMYRDIGHELSLTEIRDLQHWLENHDIISGVM